MDPALSNSSGSLDAVTYFFVSSGVFILVIAIPFFMIGLWLGRLTWGRYRRMFRESEDVMQQLKTEVSQLKRRIAEQATRRIGTFAHQPGSLAHAVVPMRGTVFPEGDMICLWTEPDWQPPKITPQPMPPSAAFSVWTLADFRPRLGVPLGRPFTLWTADDWEPAFTPQAVLPTARPFSIWTESGWEPPKRTHPWSLAFTLWTAHDWTPSPPKPPVTPGNSSFSVWTDPGWEPLKREHPWSCAFSLWTRPDWMPPVVKPAPAPENSAFSLWTEPGYEPPKRIHPWNRSFSLWTADDWRPVASKPARLPLSQAFCLWTAASWAPHVPEPKALPEQVATGNARSSDTSPSVATIFAKAKSATSRIPLMPGETSGRGSSTQRLTPSREMIAAVAASVKPLVPATASAAPEQFPSTHDSPASEIAIPETTPQAPRPVAPRPRQLQALPASAAKAPAPGLFARMVHATKAIIGLKQPTPPAKTTVAPTVKLQPAPYIEKPTPEPEQAPDPAPSTETSQFVKRTPLVSGETSKVRLPKSLAFTIWTHPAWVPPTSKTAPIPRPEGMESPPTREPKRQVLPRTTTGSVPNSGTASPSTNLKSPAATITTEVPVAAFELTPPIETPPEVVPAKDPETPPLPPSAVTSATRYEDLVARMKSITPPPSPQPPEELGISRQKPEGLPSSTVAYMPEILAGTVRNDFLLGIVFQTPPALTDDLTELKGIASVLQTRLHEMGVFTFKQIALWTIEQAHEFSGRLGFRDRAERERWREQARALHEKKYGVKL